MMFRKRNPRKPRFGKLNLDIQPRIGVPIEAIDLSRDVPNVPQKGRFILPKSPVKAPNGGKYGGGDLCVEEYDKVSELGRGAYGSVDQVVHRMTKKICALKTFRVVENSTKNKILDSRGITTDMGIRAIEMELRLLEKMDSPHIIKMLGYKIERFYVYMLVEYMNCGSLDKILKVTGTFPVFVVSCIARQVLVGLDYMHTEKGIIHRDITPENLLMNDRAVVKISDFGMANEREKGDLGNPSNEGNQNSDQSDGPVERNVFSSFVGNVKYMSPSRARGDPHTFISDVWSLGLCLRELVTAQYPLQAARGNQFEIHDALERISRGENMFKDYEVSDPSCRDFLDRCLVTDPEKRESAKKLLEHEFITKYHNQEGHMSKVRKWLFQNYIKKRKKKKGKK